MSSYITSLVHYYLSRAFFFATRSPVVAAASNKTSSSKAHVHTGEKLFKVVGHSLIDEKRTSECFSVGGHDWAVCYYPNGAVHGHSASLFLALMSDCKSKVKTSFTFTLQHPVSPAASWNKSLTCSFSSKGACQGHPSFVSKHDLTAFGYLKDDDCLVIKCSLQVTTTDDDHRNKHNDDDIRSSIVVPPSNLSTDLRDLFERGHKADLSITVGSGGGFRTFKVHGCMLAARSPVFRALLCGSMTESRQSSLDIDDMDADVFEALLYYIYNDCLPEFMEDETTTEATNMAQHLLVAADRYGVERLKLICESKLSKALDVNTVCSILDLAEQYSCLQLKAHSLKYIEMECKTRLGAIEETEGFKQLKSNHPLLARDILAKARRCRKNGQKRKKSKNNKLRKK